jgi:MFS family permease
MTQVLFLGAFLILIQQLFEVPSGIFADLYGRKYSLMIAAFFYFFSVLMFSFSYTFFNLLFAEFFLGVSFAFASGANQALAYDSLYDLGEKKRFIKVESNAFFIHGFALSISSIVGGLIAVNSLRMSFRATMIPAFILIFISFLFYEPRHHKKVGEKNYLKHFKEAFNYAYNHKKVFNLILFYGMNLTLIIIFFNLMQVYLKSLGFSIEMIGYLYALFLMIAAIISKQTSKIEKIIGEKKAILLIPIITIISLLFLIFGKMSGLIGVMLLEANWGFFMPLSSSYINHHIPSKYRATIISMNGFFFGISIIIFGPLFGKIMDLYSFKTTFIIMIFLALISLIITFTLIKNGGENYET